MKPKHYQRFVRIVATRESTGSTITRCYRVTIDNNGSEKAAVNFGKSVFQEAFPGWHIQDFESNASEASINISELQNFFQLMLV